MLPLLRPFFEAEARSISCAVLLDLEEQSQYDPTDNLISVTDCLEYLFVREDYFDALKALTEWIDRLLCIAPKERMRTRVEFDAVCPLAVLIFNKGLPYVRKKVVQYVRYAICKVSQYSERSSVWIKNVWKRKQTVMILDLRLVSTQFYSALCKQSFRSSMPFCEAVPKLCFQFFQFQSQLRTSSSLTELEILDTIIHETDCSEPCFQNCKLAVAGDALGTENGVCQLFVFDRAWNLLSESLPSG